MKKGFTLVEVLIVVVIIAILASLIVPRMLAQSEKANAAEALQMVGVVKRAAERYYDLHGTCALPGGDVKSSPFGEAPTGNWTDLGLTGIEKSKYWRFVYDGDGLAFGVAVQDTDGIPKDNYLTYASDTGIWQCVGIFKPVDNNATKGCTI